MSTFPLAWSSPLAVNVEPVLAAMPRGGVAQVREVRADGVTGERLLEMGLTPGTPVRVLRRGFLGGPWVVEVRGYVLSLGSKQAHQIHVVAQS